MVKPLPTISALKRIVDKETAPKPVHERLLEWGSEEWKRVIGRDWRCPTTTQRPLSIKAREKHRKTFG